MSLPEYNRKRSFDQTPEPQGKKGANGSGNLQFVIQKHQASHLHYDFRLELNGVLKSWAVPKGLSVNPAVKRLAMQVEDHPLEYKDFEGIIPKGNYGAGTVIIWDGGSYEPIDLETDDKHQLEKHIKSSILKGELKFRLHGEKMNGAFMMVKSKTATQENAWLIFKLKDEFAGKKELNDDRSVVSGLTLDEMKQKPVAAWKSNKEARKELKANKNIPAADKIPGNIARLLKNGTKASEPPLYAPMLATLSKEVFDSPDWIFEIKWDGYRALAKPDGADTELYSRNNLSLKKFYPIADALSQLKMKAILDGEIVALDEDGKASFQMLQQWTQDEKGSLCYMIFDLLWYDGVDLRDLPLIERKEILRALLPENPVLRYCDHVAENGKQFYELSLQAGIEGIIAKKADSIYTSGKRSKSWLKLKNDQVLEAVIAGFTQGRNSRKYFGALILAQYENGQLKYIGHTGSGMDEKMRKKVFDQLKPLVTEHHPFASKPKTNMPATWVKPELVCTVRYQEKTSEGLLRIPIFLALRTDKTAAGLEEEADYKSSLNKPAKKISPPKAKKLLLSKDKEDERKTLNGQTIPFTNLSKLYWTKEGISKRDVLNYYDSMAPFILPYMRDRPQSLNRHPNGIDGKSFYQKDVTGKVPEWIKTHGYISDTDGSEKQFLVCTDEASLLYIANLGCIEMNPWHSRIESPDRPDWCVIDLDPDGTPFARVIETARVVKKILDAVNVPSFCKTSGSTGLHIYVPLGANYSFEQSKVFAEIIANMVHHELPKTTSIERSPAKRRGLIYLDYLQNRNIQTIAAPYSLRPKPNATASAPLDWAEVKTGLRMEQFTIQNMMARVKSEGDLFKGALGAGIELEKVLEQLLSLSSK